jgi:hypothetical protein
MTRLDDKHQNNWLKLKNLQESNWIDQYVWGYYWATTIMLTIGFGDITPQTKN